MKPETKIKALTAISEATSKLSIAINEGRYSEVELILDRLKLDLTTLWMSDKVFPSGGVHSTSATSAEHDLKEVGEELLDFYRKAENEESFKERILTAKLSPEFRITQTYTTPPLNGEQMQKEIEGFFIEDKRAEQIKLIERFSQIEKAFKSVNEQFNAEEE